MQNEPKLWVSRRQGRRKTDEVAAIHLELLLRIKEKNRWGGGCFDVNEPKATSITEQNENEPENVSSTKESDVIKPSAIFPVGDLEDYDIAEKTIH